MCCTCPLIQSNGEFKMTILTELNLKMWRNHTSYPALKKNNTTKAIIYNKYQLQEHMEVILTVKKAFWSRTGKKAVSSGENFTSSCLNYYLSFSLLLWLLRVTEDEFGREPVNILMHVCANEQLCHFCHMIDSFIDLLSSFFSLVCIVPHNITI